MAGFIWDEKNTQHIAEHGVTRADAEYVVTHARDPYPRDCGAGKVMVRGQTAAGRFLQVIVVMESDADIDYSEIDLIELDVAEDAFYVIHARLLEPDEISALKRARKKS